MTGEGDLKKLPLEDLHKAAGAKFGGFAGWSMPLTYRVGVMKEHQHTREHAGLFDISHMKLFLLTGPGAAALLSRACPLDAAALEIEHSKYTFFLNEKAGIVDDLIITRLAREQFLVVANAGNATADEARLKSLASGFDAEVEPLDIVFLAIQGPQAAEVLAKAGVGTESLAFMTGQRRHVQYFISRSGYTGEDGFEIGLPENRARELVAKLLEDDRVMWVGLAARDSLRLEAGLCLHGQDLTPETDPASAALMWAIPKEVQVAGGFIGAEALRAILERGPAQKRVGLKPEGRQPVRAGVELFNAKGNAAGHVTSCGFGPSAGSPVAMGYVPMPLAKPGAKLFADVRGSRLPVDVAALPFTPHRYRKG